ncbi:hypothetical protein BBR47_20860 [Brevibacillus brevis NBRC 100599]|uniref:Uncharacterized protein n=1 Tax=Brevibacillus brevis (strain 47 / JCM 6285 / NBRC 100599) TaxID=358681 RepID=C0ZBA4_BREBN|nr:hypothetical protein BBR47_20860 [Brevibacillus brevis NBRC 100599]
MRLSGGNQKQVVSQKDLVQKKVKKLSSTFGNILSDLS